MKKNYTSPVVHVMAIDANASMLAASDSSAQNFKVKVNGYSYEEDNARDGSSIKGSEMLAKPLLWDDSENE
jgi:precorrin-6B methylase 2